MYYLVVLNNFDPIMCVQLSDTRSAVSKLNDKCFYNWLIVYCGNLLGQFCYSYYFRIFHKLFLTLNLAYRCISPDTRPRPRDITMDSDTVTLNHDWLEWKWFRCWSWRLKALATFIIVTTYTCDELENSSIWHWMNLHFVLCHMVGCAAIWDWFPAIVITSTKRKVI